MLKGWIGATESDRVELESFGIILGEYDHQNQEYKDCLISEEAFNKLAPLWGVYYWGLY